jgi:hypothetical protein
LSRWTTALKVVESGGLRRDCRLKNEDVFGVSGRSAGVKLVLKFSSSLLGAVK